MGFFDPPHEKIIGWSPADFQALARALIPTLDATIAELGVPPSGQKLLRTAIVGRLALIVADEDPGRWTPTNLQLVRTYTDNAERLIPARFYPVIPQATEVLLAALARTLAMNALPRGEQTDTSLG